MSKVHCIICDRKDPFVWHIRLPRNKITVPVCPKCAERYALYNKDITSLKDLLISHYVEIKRDFEEEDWFNNMNP